MKHILTMLTACFTLLTVGCNQQPQLAMENVVIEQIEVHDDSVFLFFTLGYDNQDIWVHVSEDTEIYTQFDETLEITDLEVGDVLIMIQFDEVMESYPLQTNAHTIEVKS